MVIGYIVSTFFVFAVNLTDIGQKLLSCVRHVVFPNVVRSFFFIGHVYICTVLATSIRDSDSQRKITQNKTFLV